MRTSRFLNLAALGLVLSFSTQAADAAPLTLSLEEYEQLVGVSLVEGFSGSTAIEVEQEPTEAKPQPSPQDAMLPGGSMTGSTPSSVNPGGVPAVAIASLAIACQPALVARSVDQPGSLLIPPRFLDGIFRPPRVIYPSARDQLFH